MEQKAWINVKSPRFSYLYDQTRYCGDVIWLETRTISNVYALNPNFIYLLCIWNMKVAFWGCDINNTP